MLLLTIASTLLLTSIASTQSNNSPSISTNSALSLNINNEWISSSFGLMLEDNQTIAAFNHQDLYSHTHHQERRDFNTTSHSKIFIAHTAKKTSNDLTRDIASKSLKMKMNEDGELLWLDQKEENEESIPLIGRRSYSGSKSKHTSGGKKPHRSSDSSIKTSNLSKMSSSWKELVSNAKKSKSSTSNKKSTTSSSASKKISSSTSSSTAKGTSNLSQAVKFIQLPATRTFTAVITWYNGNGLKNPFCAQNSKWTPTDSSMIAAVTEKWGDNRPACGSFLQVRTGKFYFPSFSDEKLTYFCSS